MAVTSGHTPSQPGIAVEKGLRSRTGTYVFWSILAVCGLSVVGSIHKVVGPRTTIEQAELDPTLTKPEYVSAGGYKPISFSVQADPGVEYVIFDVIKRPDGLVEIISRRWGSSGVSYAKRLVNCRNWTFKYLSEGDTIAELAVPKPDEDMSQLTPGSSSTVVSYYGCNSVGLAK